MQLYFRGLVLDRDNLLRIILPFQYDGRVHVPDLYLKFRSRRSIEVDESFDSTIRWWFGSDCFRQYNNPISTDQNWL